MKNFFRTHRYIASLLSIFIAVFLVAIVTSATTTIDTNVTTGGYASSTGSLNTAGTLHVGTTATIEGVLTSKSTVTSTSALNTKGSLHVGTTGHIGGIVTTTGEYVYIQHLKFEPIATPSPAVAGKCFVDSGDNQLNCYDGSAWQHAW